MEVKATITHFLHPDHPLINTNNGYKYICNGCRLPGEGDHYRCDLCDFDIHLFCAILPDKIPLSGDQSQNRSLVDGPLSGGQPNVSMELNPKPDRSQDGSSLRRCDGCLKPVEGMFYHTDTGNFDLHAACFIELVKQAKVDAENGCNERGFKSGVKKVFGHGFDVILFLTSIASIPLAVLGL